MNLEYLPDKTKQLFKTFSVKKFLKDYVLIGGSALSIQISHRLSEDLDFIFDGEFIDKRKIKRFISLNFKGNFKIIREDENYQIDFLIAGVKVTFFSTGAIIVPFKIIEHSTKYKELNIASIEIIAVLKMAVISQRMTIRDYYDLYYISKHYMQLKDVFKLTRELLPNLSQIVYSETIIYVEDIKEDTIDLLLNPKDKITKFEIADYFINELKYLKIDFIKNESR